MRVYLSASAMTFQNRSHVGNFGLNPAFQLLHRVDPFNEIQSPIPEFFPPASITRAL
jgi:hypothetical protein